MKNNKGFTLIELLAVIVILAIIALIATPLTINVINDAKLKADENSASGVLDGARLYYAEQMLKDTPNLGSEASPLYVSALSLSGEAPSNASTAKITFGADGKISISDMKFKNGGCFKITNGKVEKGTACPTN